MRSITGNSIRSMLRSASLSSVCMTSVCIASIATAQESEDSFDTAKVSDTVSPYGVSYTTGAFTYSLPLFTIGHGEWPNQITVSLNYDSSAARRPNEPWSLSIQRRVSTEYVEYVTGFEGDPLWEYHQYGLNLSLGNRSQKFELGDYTLSASSFQSASKDGSTVEFTDGQPGTYGSYFFRRHGEFKVIGSDGSVMTFEGGMFDAVDGPLVASSGPTLTLPNGFTVEYSDPGHLDTKTYPIFSSNGLFIRMFGNQVCAFNAAYTDPATVSSCASSSVVATINETPMAAGNSWQLPQVTSVIRPDGGTYTFEYESYYSSHSYEGASDSATRYHLTCVKEPGQSVCAVQNTYDPCDGPRFVYNNPDFFGRGSWVIEDSEWTGSRDRVISQQLADGRTVTYDYGAPLAGGCRHVGSVTMNEGGATTAIGLHQTATPRTKQRSYVATVVDPLQRTTLAEMTGENPQAYFTKEYNTLKNMTNPGGQRVEYLYDERGNRIETRIKAAPGSNDPDIVSTASFTLTCTNRKTCNKPSSVTDAKGNTTQFTYSTAHGGVLTRVGPAVDGVSPATKFYYVQREAWFKQGSGYAKSGSPVWLLSEERSCRTSALNLSNGTCAAGAGDLVRTTYDYGPDSGPNNLWLRGTAVVADGQTLRTCLGYDELGRRISETQPKADLANCQ